MTTSTTAGGGVSVPLLCALLLVGAGIAMVLLPVKAEGPCHGNAATVLASPETSSVHWRECHDTARNELVFGAATAVVGLGLAGFSLSVLRRTA